MKEQWRISKERLVALEDGVRREEDVSGTKIQEKSAKCKPLLRFAKLLLFVPVILFVGWFGSSLWPNYRGQSMQVKASGYVMPPPTLFQQKPSEYTDEPSMDFVGSTESSKQRLEDAAGSEIRDSKETSTDRWTSSASGWPIAVAVTQKPDSEINRDAIASNEAAFVSTSEAENVAEETTARFSGETEDKESLEKTNSQDTEAEARLERGENVEWVFPFAWSIHGLQGEETSDGNQKEESESEIESPKGTKDDERSEVDDQLEDELETTVESRGKEVSGVNEQFQEKLESPVEPKEDGSDGGWNDASSFEPKSVADPSFQDHRWDGYPRIYKEVRPTEPSDYGVSDADEFRGPFEIADVPTDYYRDDIIDTDGFLTPDEYKEYAQHDFDDHYGQEAVPVDRSTEYEKSDTEDQNTWPFVNSHVDDGYVDTFVTKFGTSDESREYVRLVSDRHDVPEVEDIRVPFLPDKIDVGFDPYDFQYEDEDDIASMNLATALLLGTLIHDGQYDDYFGPYGLEHFKSSESPVSDENDRHARILRVIRSISTDSSREVSGKMGNALVEGVKPGTLLRQAILGRRGQIIERMREEHGYDQELLQQNLHKFFARMEILASHIDRLHERYHRLNDLNDDYVSKEFSTETLDR